MRIVLLCSIILMSIDIYTHMTRITIVLYSMTIIQYEWFISWN